MVRLWILVVWFVAQYPDAWAQCDTALKPVLEPELNIHAGKLIKIHGEYPPNDVSLLQDACIMWRTRGRSLWHSDFHYPSAGVYLIHAQYGNNRVLGSSLSVAPVMRFEWRSGRGFWAVRAGIGAGIFNRPYEAESNPANLVIGSRITAMATGWVGYMWPVTNEWRLQCGLAGTHWSNGHIAVPNIGANIVSATVGIAYTSTGIERWQTGCPHARPEWRKRLLWSMQLMQGRHEMQGTIKPIGGPLYSVQGASLSLRFKYTRAGGAEAGLHYHYYQAFHDYIITQELFEADEAKGKARNVVLFAGYEWRFGHMAFYVQAGVNLYAPFYHEFNKVWDLPKKGWLNEWTANKLGYRYYPLRSRSWQPYLSLSLKSNGGTADFLEAGVGICR